MTDEKLAKLFFIGGSGKSGTTWLQQILNAHPTVACNGEAHLFDILLAQLSHTLDTYNEHLKGSGMNLYDDPDRMAPLTKGDFSEIVANLIDTLIRRIPDQPTSKVEGFTHIGEKTPENCRHYQFAAQLCSKARFIHVVRDPRDSITSGWLQAQKVSPNWLKEHFRDFHHYVFMCAQAWQMDTQYGLKFVNEGDKCLIMRYESLHTEPVHTLNRVCMHLEIPADPSQIKQMINAVKPEGKNFRKGVIGDWVNYFDDQAKGIVQAVCKDTAAELGYMLDEEEPRIIMPKGTRRMTLLH